MEFIKHWKKILAIILITMSITTVLITLETTRAKSEYIIYAFNSGWIMFQDYNSQYCNNIPSGIMNERYKRARLKFSEITKSKYWISTFEDYEINTNLTAYLNSVVTSMEGIRYLGKAMGGDNESYHTGIDIAMKIGTPIKPFASGKVVSIGNDPKGYGKNIVIQQKNGKYVYGHLSQINVRKNQIVGTNYIIGLSGNTGRSTGAHLHYGAIN